MTDGAEVSSIAMVLKKSRPPAVTLSFQRKPTPKNIERNIMLSKVKTLKGYKLKSLDGEIGTVKEFYFDDVHWTIRYLVANTGNWLTGRQVLISPYALVAISEGKQSIAINLTKEQIENSPSLKSHEPVSHQFEENYYGYFGWPMYWGGPYSWGSNSHIMHDRERWKEISPGENKTWDLHLRSTHAVSGYKIQALDGNIGDVVDFVIDDQTWAIRYLIVDTGTWWPRKKVLVSPQWIERVSWQESKVFVNLEREMIKGAPAYLSGDLNREYELKLYRHYGRFANWADEPLAQAQLKAKNMKPPKYQNQQSSPSETMTDRKKIEHRAYELFVERGSTPGCDLEDWLQAEEEFKSPGQAAMSR